MRPNAPHNPPVEPVEERSDVGSLVVMAPPAQYRIEFLDQLLGLKRYASPGKRAHLIHEAADRFLPGDSVQFPRLSTTANLARWQPKLLAAPIARPRRKDDRLAEAGSVSGSGARPSGHRWHAASVINIQPPTPHINPHSISVETPADAQTRSYLLRSGSPRSALRRTLIHRTYQPVFHHSGSQKCAD